MVEFNWLTALVGGILIGLSATLLLAFNGRVAVFILNVEFCILNFEF